MTAAKSTPGISKTLWEFPRTRFLRRKCLICPFIWKLSQGTLESSSFKCYVGQDAYFLKAFRSAYSSGKESASKMPDSSTEIIEAFSKFEAAVDNELRLHAEYANKLGIDLASTKPLPATTAYVSFLEKACEHDNPTENVAHILVAMAPCNRLYQWLGSTLAKGGAKNTAGEYEQWIEEYASDEFQTHTETIESLLDSVCSKILKEKNSESLNFEWLSDLRESYIQAMEHELAFFDQQPGMQQAYQELSTENIPDYEAGENPYVSISGLLPPRVLIVAGSDSGGGAGIQADIKASSALGAFSMTAVTALTAQDSESVKGIFPVPVDFVQKQMETVLLDFGADVVKTGMLATEEVVTGVAKQLRSDLSVIERWNKLLICDPVMVSTSGDVLLEQSAIEMIIKELFPISFLVTPNIREAELLLNNKLKIKDKVSMEKAAKMISKMGPKWVYLKGGSLKNIQTDSVEVVKAVDILCNGETGECKEFTVDMIETDHVHGTGCTLASSIAALLARGYMVEEAVTLAKGYVTGAIKASANLQLGSGPQGPLNHQWRNFTW